MGHCKTETRGRSIIEDVKCVAIDFDRFREGIYCRSQRVEGVRVFSLLRHFRKSKTWQIWCDDPVAIGQARNQLAIHKRRRRKSMQKKNHRRLRIAGLSVKHLNAI